MRRFACPACKKRGLTSEWEHHHVDSFCPACGKPGHIIVEYACFECAEAGLKFWAKVSPSAACPDCGEPAPRVVYLPMLASAKKDDYRFADQALETGLAAADLTDVRPPAKPRGEFSAYWGSPANVLAQARGAGRAERTNAPRLPRRLPTHIVGADTRKIT